MSLAHYRTLGRSGLRVSPLCLGTMTFGEDWGWGSTVAESEAILTRYLERGGNFIDTANGYTKGHSEVIIGDYFARTAGRRHRAVIATKFSTNLYPGDPNAGGAGRKGIVEACEDELDRIETKVPTHTKEERLKSKRERSSVKQFRQNRNSFDD